MSVVSMKQLLESGVHFGHQTHKWNPKMDRYIFLKRNGIHILDLKQTLDAVNEAYMFVKEIASQGKSVLFVGTKKQAKDAIEEAAKNSESYYVSNRWAGGMLTNMKTIRNSIAKLDYYEQIAVVEVLMKTLFCEGTTEKLMAAFIDVAMQSGLNLDTLYTLYVGKNILNQFRQDHGYKEGTYIKIWNGEEDNVTMQKVLEENENVTPNELYTALEAAYPKE